MLHISSLYPTQGDPAYGKVVHEAVKAAGTLGWTGAVIAPQPVWRNEPRGGNPEEPGTAKAPVVLRPHYLRFPRGWWPAASIAGMKRGIQRAFTQSSGREVRLDRLRLVHAHRTFPEAAAARTLRAPLIVTVRVSDMLSATKSRSRSSVIRQTLHHADAIITPSVRLAEFVRDMGIKKPTSVIPNGIVVPEQRPDTSPLRHPTRQGRNSGGRLRLLTVARLDRNKRVDAVIAGVATATAMGLDCELRVVGDGPLRRRLEVQGQELGIEQRVHFLGRLPHSDVWDTYRWADAMVLLSEYETFGLVYAEALMCGVPVIGMAGQGLDGMVENGKHGLMLPDRRQVTVAKSLIRLGNDWELRQRLGGAGRSLVKGWTWDAYADAVVDVYRRIATTSGKASM